jgi:hypothetical protein
VRLRGVFLACDALSTALILLCARVYVCVVWCACMNTLSCVYVREI